MALFAYSMISIALEIKKSLSLRLAASNSARQLFISCLLLCVLTAATRASTCCDDDDPESMAKDAGHHLDTIEHNLAEWGHASISGFVLVQDRSDFFDLNYSLPTSNYVAWFQTNVSGQAAFLQEKQTTIQATATAANSVQGLNVAGAPQPLTGQQQLLNNALSQNYLAYAQTYATSLQAWSNSLLAWTNSYLSSTNGSSTNPPPAPPLPPNVSAVTNPPTGPTNLLPQLPALLSNTVPSPIAANFSPLGQVAPQMSGNQLSPPTVLQNAMTAKEIERVLGFMSHPIDLPRDKQVFFALGQISVMPGWRTKKDYICEVSVRLAYTGLAGDLLARSGKLVKAANENKDPMSELIAKEAENTLRTDYPNEKKFIRIYSDSARAEKLHWNDSKSSLSLAAAFPFTESTVFDLQNGYRNQMNFLMNLAATYAQIGYTIGANALFNYVKQTQKDISTRTAFPTVIPGVEADMLTYRFDPEATAMTDPTETEPTSGNLLLPSSIPVLMLVVCDKNGLKRWPEISIDIETRWIPRQHKSFWSHTYSVIVHGRIQDKLQYPSHSLDMAADIDLVTKEFQELYSWNDFAQANRGQIDELRRRLFALKTIGIGRSTIMKLPDVTPSIKSVTPATIPDDYNGTIVVNGDYFGDDTDGVHVRLSGIDLNVASIANDRIEATVKSSRKHLLSGLNDLSVENSQGACVLTQAVMVTTFNPSYISFNPTSVPRDFHGNFTLSGLYLGNDPKDSVVTIGGIPLKTISVSENALTARLKSNRLRLGVNDIGFKNHRGAFTVSAAVNVSNAPLPVITAISPTNFSQNFKGDIILTGQNFGDDDNNPSVWIGGVKLNNVNASDNTVIADLNSHAQLFPIQTNDLIFHNDRGSYIASQALIVKAPAPTRDSGHKLGITSVYPKEGFANAPTTFFLRGTNFNPEGMNDKVQTITVGGHAITNFIVSSDTLIRLEVPAWITSNITNKDGLKVIPFISKETAADIVIASASDSDTTNNAIYFDLSLPSGGSNSTNSASAVDKLIDKQASAIKALAAAQSNDVPQLIGSLRIELGPTNSGSKIVGSPTSTVIIQNGQNTNSLH